MAAYGSFDVRMVPGEHHGDASENPWMHYQHAFIVLMELIEETIIHVSPPICARSIYNTNLAMLSRDLK